MHSFCIVFGVGTKNVIVAHFTSAKPTLFESARPIGSVDHH